MTSNEGDWSVPEPQVLERVRDRLESGESAESDEGDVLATVVDVEGAAYRRPGAKTLLSADGEGVGAVTAGCLADELRRVAAEVRETGAPRLVTYDLRADEADEAWGLGVGCNGVVDVLLEPVAESLRPAVEAVAEGRDTTLLTVLADDGPLERGDRAYYHPDADRFEPVDGDGGEWPADALSGPAGELAERGRATVLEIDRGAAGRLEAFVDGLAAPPELLIVGAGRDVAPVVELGPRNGFRTTVVGFRGGIDLSERFPAAHRTATTSPSRIRETLDVDDRAHAVVMSHNFVDDRLTVDELLRSPAPYVGLLGPRERFEEMLEAFEDEGRTFDEAELDRLYTPAGLDLGAGSPYGIAHSIVAEALAVANDREPRHLRARDGPVHDRVDLDADANGSG